MKNKFTNILWGLIFIGAGICYAGNAFELWNFSLFFDGWWTLFIIIPCLMGIVQYGFATGPIIGLTFGAMLLLSAQGVINSSIAMKLIFPVVLVLIGIEIIFKNNLNKNMNRIANRNKDGIVEYTAIFGGSEEVFPNENFNGASMLSIFGGTKLNLMNAIISEDVVINSISIFGGGDVIVPNNVNVKISSTPIFGGVSNKARPCLDPNAPTIYINATCIFGGLDVK